MSDITIVVPKGSDVDTMVAWGRGNRELVVSKEDRWYEPKTIKDWIANPHGDIILVAKDKEKLVGMCLVHKMREFAYCSTLFVVKEYRGQGIGRRLLDTVSGKLKAQGIRQFAILVEENNENSQKFYDKVGFKKGFVFRWMDKRIE